ncbi:iron ABC transporter permease [Halobacillus halophilus]|uniref:ABC-type transport system permease protein (Probable substrate iron complex) n=1 Tax=Halobacillus halophilus (strain ATCC 35676 / DSM 2266 / JCM 20832 / KCTC 3685 / LMG 17431 / NBRC 102448 / NCIMB 2269) TaxID=866895 RepID=I0JR99_HALH3|nr:iron ABC transporter permease [Halobacillus halophilus]ASF40655.1 iron ABC transporter permease [Halobacillus halophilus]CCG46669.1 ABC-type transport system permease protein (probable substrate iron complex) [Halobacillus halophilus DSM 2266]
MYSHITKRPKGLKETKPILITFFLFLFTIATVIFAIGMGPVSVPAATASNILLSNLPYLSSMVESDWTQLDENIIWGLRLPRVLLGLIVGASLSVTGVTLQALVRNHLADPFILGVSSGASATATLGMLFGTFSFLGTYSLSISAFLGAAFVIIVVYALSRVNGKINMTQLLLSGVAIGLIMESITKLITLSAPNALGLHNATFWMAGSLAGAKWEYLTLPLLAMIICMTILLINYRALNALLAGDEAAGTLGFNVNILQTMLVLIASLLAGVTIAVSGSIGFVGLMVPHITRLLVGSDHKKVLPVSAFLGGILVVWTDVAARLIIAPEELPIGVLTAIIGGPFFIWLLKRNARK